MRNDYVVVILWSLLKSKVTKSRPWWFFPSHPLLTILSITSGFSREGDSIEEDSPGGLVVACFFFFLFFLLVLTIFGSNTNLSVESLPCIKEKEQTTINRKHQG